MNDLTFIYCFYLVNKKRFYKKSQKLIIIILIKIIASKYSFATGQTETV